MFGQYIYSICICYDSHKIQILLLNISNFWWLIVLFIFIATSSTQGLLQALCSGLTPDEVQGHCEVMGMEQKRAAGKANALAAVLFLSPNIALYFLFWRLAAQDRGVGRYD